MLVSSLIEACYGRRISRIKQVIAAIAVPKSMAEALRADAASPALEIVGRYLDANNEAFEIPISIHPAGRPTVSTELMRSKE